VNTPVERQGEPLSACRSIADNSATKLVTTSAANRTTMTKAVVQQAWTAYQTAEKHGVELGKVLFEYRETHKSKGGFGSEGEGLVQLLDEWSYRTPLGIAQSPAIPTSGSHHTTETFVPVS
jgi:hypothetical protein